jgi:hypothetical protein
MDEWRETLNTLNDKRSRLVYKLLDDEGKDPGDGAALAAIQASDHPKLTDLNNAIADHVAAMPKEND